MSNVRKLKLSKFPISPRAKAWIDEYLSDILERGSRGDGNLYTMLREAYVLGLHHAALGIGEKDA